MSVVVILPLDDEDAAHLTKMAREGGAGLTLTQLCASIIACVAADDRAAHKVEGDAA